MRAVIVASGPSAKGFTPPNGLPIIAVNGVIDWISRADYWFSLDASPANQARFNNRRPDTEYHVAGKKWLPLLPDRGGVYYWTRVDSLGTYDEPATSGSPEWWLHRLGAVRGINKTAGYINTGNSAWGALGLAWHLGFRDVALVGVDANNERRVEGGWSLDLSHLPLLFSSAHPDMRVTSCGAMRAANVHNQSFKDWHENR